MNRLIVAWHYQQEKGLMWKEWAKGVQDGRPVEGVCLQEWTGMRQHYDSLDLTHPAGTHPYQRMY